MCIIKKQSSRKSCRDVFHAFLVKNANYDKNDIPFIKPTKSIPNKVISFKDSLKSKDYHQWVHFYIDDFHFEKIWTYTRKYLKILKRFDGVILPDFSVYRDMPIYLQTYNIYRSRAIGNFLQTNDINVIANVRFGDERTFEISCLGLSIGQTIAIGTNGTAKFKFDREYLERGFDYVIDRLKPKNIIIYGSITKHIQEVAKEKNINIINFRSEQYKRYGGK